MNNNYNPNLKVNAQKLRKEMTREERHLWYDFLKNLPVTVKRQQIVGNYILDFYIAKEKIAIELDGSQHYEGSGRKRDTERDSFLENVGIKVLRYSNYDVNVNFNSVCEDIMKNLNIQI